MPPIVNHEPLRRVYLIEEDGNPGQGRRSSKDVLMKLAKSYKPCELFLPVSSPFLGSQANS